MSKTIILKIILIILAIVVAIGSITAIVVERNKGPVIEEYSVSSDVSNNNEDITQSTTETTNTQTTTETTAAKAKFSTTKMVDYDNMQFAVNGKVYTLGKTTLQDMLDDNVPFYEIDELQEMKDKRIGKPRACSVGDYYIDCGDYTISVKVAFTDPTWGKGNVPMKNWVLDFLDYSMNYPDRETIISFPFQFNITAKDLKADAGEPESSDEYWYEYVQDLDVKEIVGTASPNQYSFHFRTERDDLLDRVVMSYSLDIIDENSR